jgi:hypothetical protein
VNSTQGTLGECGQDCGGRGYWQEGVCACPPEYGGAKCQYYCSLDHWKEESRFSSYEDCIISADHSLTQQQINDNIMACYTQNDGR